MIRSSNRLILIILACTVFLVFSAVVFMRVFDSSDTKTAESESVASVSLPDRLALSGLQTDFSSSNIELEKVLSGGPGKDGIPALTNPAFTTYEKSAISADTEVLVVENNNEVKVYPYNILVWHEIVNDTVGDEPLAITFCPLCGSAIVFSRQLKGETIELGVSGLLYESNMLMYVRDDTESLFSQSLGSAVIGNRIGETLGYFPFQKMSYDEAEELYPNALVLSEETGFSRDYRSNPYGDYDDTEQLFFEVSNVDNRFPGKQLFYIIPIPGMSVAVNLDKEDGQYQVPDSDIVVTLDKGQVTARWGNEIIPGYYEMWFSWATHNQDTGFVL